MNIIRTIQTTDKHSDIITSRRFPGHVAATADAKASVHPNRVAEIDRLTLRPFESVRSEINSCGEGCAGLPPAQRAMAMSNPFGVFAGPKTYITA